MKCPRVQLLGCVVIAGLALRETTKLASGVATPVHSSTSSACTSLPALSVSLCFILANLIGVECAFHPGLLTLSTIDNLHWRIPCVVGRAVLYIEGCLAACIPDLYLLDARSSPHSIVTTKNIFRYC